MNESSGLNKLPDWLRGDTRPRWRRPSTWLAGVALLALLAAAAGWWQERSAQAAPHYVTAEVTRGDVAVTVTATGTLQPTRAVNIGSELSGTVSEVLVDINDRVKKGQPLVRLDSAKLADQVTRSKAALGSAQAGLAQARAAMQAAQVNASRLQEVQRLSGGKVPSAAELDTARTALEQARAAQASAQAGVIQAQAQLSTDQTNLGKASIRSPIDGVILSRSVDPGNAVAASLQAVTLFTMAEDLTRMKLLVNVDEADVGQVRSGQRATFTVSAWPGRKYPAAISRVAYGSTTTDNVVTYAAQLDVANPDLTLRPGMTATATIAAAERQGVLLVPNTALSFQPGLAGAAPQAGSGSGSLVSKLMPRPPGMGQRNRRGSSDAAGPPRGDEPQSQTRQIWVLRDGQPVPLTVRVGLSNGRLTEISGEGVTEGLAVITEQRSSATAR